MENNDADKKETDESTPQRRCKPKVKFAPKVLPKKMPKIIPKREPHEENKVLTIDKKVMTGIGSFQEHDEPWDYNKCTNYPVTLPLRWPNSGDTGSLSLDEEEFSRSLSKAQDGELTAAEELGLMERVDMPHLLFFQFPTSLPLPRETDPAAETETNTIVNGNVKSMGNYRKRMLDSGNACNLKELSGGLMGKILIYKSGKVKMKLGDVLFDVAAGSNCMFVQEVVPIDTRILFAVALGSLENVQL
ncbi:hypothetical protein BDA96_04G168300 [Sorghum bicolor]|uniref:DNA-directed RNA polymerase III subunit RPC4 n=2 Tax=Sorghum bicolor TaxID=4558 RepID=A0A921UIB9_SORBI|nr:hypothetical protein BDA96_04G168300 [Sorghum bicolor]OQU85013.1 hypothetical protein SORBI_3004G157500 [Sorghum bicolor]